MDTTDWDPDLELWGGIECTVNRVGDVYFDQMAIAGHLNRLDDLDAIAALGIRKLRYGFPWETENWQQADQRMCGKVDSTHPLYGFLRQEASSAELAYFQAAACPPDVLGINYYVTSDRTLDHRLDLHPARFHGGNDKEPYADVDSARGSAGIVGHEGALKAAWQRYRKPLCITEVHLDCHREDQLRWLAESWNAAVRLRKSGVDVRAVTAWSMLGAFNWNTLCTRVDGYYESGVFDLRSPKPRPTALAQAVSSLALTGRFSHACLSQLGWWRDRETGNGGKGRPLLITGADGFLAQGFQRACEKRRLDFVALDHKQLDTRDGPALEAFLKTLRPWAVINTAGYRVGVRHRNPERHYQVNVDGAMTVATCAAKFELPVLTFSNDSVFAGRLTPYDENDEPDPKTWFGQAQAYGDRIVAGVNPRALVVRTGPIFAAGSGVPPDTGALPTYLPDVARVALDLLIDGETGLWHLAHEQCQLAESQEIRLTSKRASIMPRWEDALLRYVEALQLDPSSVPLAGAQGFGS